MDPRSPRIPRAASPLPLLLALVALSTLVAMAGPLPAAHADAAPARLSGDTPSDAETGEKATGDEAEDEDEEPEWSVSEPPGDWVTVDIDTDEITWSDVDVSPDGSTLVFHLLGDIYTVPIGGGEATALTEGIAWDFQPRFAPDGESIAFISDRDGADNLWLMDADGSDPRAVTEEKRHLIHNPSWSADGEYLVANKDYMSTRSVAASEIWLYHVAGGQGLQLVERPHGERDQKTIGEPTFSPDGRYVYYTQDATSGVVWQYEKDSTGQIYVVKRLDRETGETEELAGGPGGAVRPVPSPDGRYLAFVKRTPAMTSALYLMELASGNQRPLYDQLDRDLQEAFGSQGNYPAYAWTPDSREIVFWSGGKIRKLGVESGEVEPIPIRVTGERKVRPALRFPVEVAPGEVEIEMPRWAQMAPDGETILFQALGYLWIQDGPDGEPRRLTGQSDHFEFYPSFSRDGRWIVYTTWDDQELGSVRVVSASGGEGRVVTAEPGHYVEPRFSPNGEVIVYRKFAGGYLLAPFWSLEPGIYVVDAEGGEPERIVDSGSDAHFAAAPDRVYFTASGDGTERVLKSVDLHGLDERTHLEGAEVTEFGLSPDGRWVAFRENYNVWVAPFVATGKTVDIEAEMKSLPARQVSSRAGEFLHWSADGSTLHWSHGATLYSRPLSEAFAFLEGAPEELPEPLAEGIDLSFTIAADVPEGRIALVGGRVVTMRDAASRQEVIEHGVVIVSGNRIEAVGPTGEIDIPADAETIDVTGKTIIPGLVDAHAHGAQARNEITPEQNWGMFANLAFGVTTLHDPSNDTSSVFSAAEMQRAGAIVAPRIFSTGTILYGAHVPDYKAEIDSLEDALFHVRRLQEVGAVSVKSYNQPRRDARQMVIEAAHQLGVMVVPEGGGRFEHNLTEIVDGHTGIEHAIPLARGYEDVVQLWAQTGVGYTPTFVVAYGGQSGERYWYEHTDVWENEHLMRYTPRMFVEPRAMRRSKSPDLHYNHFFVARFAEELAERGVSVQIGAHGQLDGLAAHWEMWMLEQGGFTPWEALRAATLDGARYVGMDGDIGSLEVGKLADLAVIDGNPLDDLRQSEIVVYTMINGRLYDTATMNQVAPESVERQPFFFELDGGDTIHPEAVEWIETLRRRHGWDH